MLCNIMNMFSKPSGLGTMNEERNREKEERKRGGERKEERREEKMKGWKEKNRKNSLDKK